MHVWPNICGHLTHFLNIPLSALLRKLFTSFWNFCILILKSTDQVRPRCCVNKPSAQTSQFIPERCPVELRVRSLCGLLEFFYTKFGKPCLQRSCKVGMGNINTIANKDVTHSCVPSILIH